MKKQMMNPMPALIEVKLCFPQQTGLFQVHDLGESRLSGLWETFSAGYIKAIQNMAAELCDAGEDNSSTSLQAH